MIEDRLRYRSCGLQDLPEIVKYLLEFKNFFMMLLLAASVLSFVAYGLQPDDPLNLYLACALIFIVLLNTVISSVIIMHTLRA